MKRALCILLCLMMALALCLPAFAEEDVTVPEVTIEARDIPDTEALAFARGLGAGWNLGNTFDAWADDWQLDEMELESSWCKVLTTEDMIEALQAAGFTTVRIPVSWHNHVSGEDFTISGRWLDRVQEVVNWAYSRGMYVILNIHHDFSAVDAETQWITLAADHYEADERYVTAIWRQVAERFADYDEHLIFESMNEPRLVDNKSYEWNFVGRVTVCREAAESINRLNQAFVDTVRAAGGRNADRYLMVPAYDASPDNACTQYFTLPTDTAEGQRVMVSAHAYTPYAFALDAGGRSGFTIPAGGREIDSFMDRLYNTFIVNGVPVVIGEFGARDKDNYQARVNFTAYYVAAAAARGIPVVWWDNNAFSGEGELFGLLRRRFGKWRWPAIVEAMMTYQVTP